MDDAQGLTPDRFRRNAAAIMAIPAGEGKEGTVACPTCRKPLHFAYTQTGLKAACETPDCTNLSE